MPFMNLYNNADMEIKVCGLTQPDNMAQVLDAGPDYIGFIFYDASKRFAGNDYRMMHFARQLTGVKKVGVFVNADLVYIAQQAQDYGLDVVQLHGNETPEYCRLLSRHIALWKAFAIHPGFDFATLAAYAPYCERFLFDTPGAGYGGTGRAFDWTMPALQNITKPFLLSGGIGPGDEDKVKAVNLPGFAGIDLNSRFETSPGLKNATELKKFIHAVRY